MSVTGSGFDSSYPSSASFQFSPSPTPTLTPSPSPPTTFMPNQTFSPSPPPEPEMPLPPSHTSTQDADINNQPPRKPRALKSAVWAHFERIEVEGLPKVKCLHCGHILSGNTKNGTSHLKDHLTLRCSRKISQVDIRQECVEFYFNEIYGYRADDEVERVKGLLYDLMVEYQERASSSEKSTSSTARGTVLGKRKSSPISLSDEEKLDKWSQIKKTKKKKVNVKSELDHYLEEDALPESSHFDILKFWNIELKYPTLQRIARDILAIPASTVASGSAFSMGGRVVSPHRSRLHADTVEALMCLQNWIIREYSAYSMENAQACASILEDDDVGE